MTRIVTVIKGGKIFHNTLPSGPRVDLTAKAGLGVDEYQKLAETS